MKNEKNLMQMVIAGLLSALLVVLVMGRGERVVVVNEGYSRPPVVSSSIIPQFGDNDPDWWQNTIPFSNQEDTEESNIYCIKEVTNVLDGDTFDAVLEWDEETVDGTVRIRLAGINCPERFDQNCWLEALDFTTDYLFEIDENGNRRTAKDLRIQIFAKDSGRDRYVGLVFNKNQTAEDNKVTLGYELLQKGYALPCFSYLVKYKITNYMLHYLDAVEEARKGIRWLASDHKYANVWGASEDRTPSRKNIIDIHLEPLISDDAKSMKHGSIIKGDKITIDIIRDNYIEALQERNTELLPEIAIYPLTGYSLIDETSWAVSRFFIPTVNLKCHNDGNQAFKQNSTFDNDKCTGDKDYPYLEIFSGRLEEGVVRSWDPDNDDSCEPKVYMLRSGNMVNEDRDTIFLRNADRRVIAWAYWDGEECIQAEGMKKYLEKKYPPKEPTE